MSRPADQHLHHAQIITTKPCATCGLPMTLRVDRHPTRADWHLVQQHCENYWRKDHQ